ncbi:5-deoxy-glucuronate isomerase [Advenella mimigardefordensis]|uniref:Putative 5-deoxy-glucuronate isomerase n=1 Tax=Advenella mimigardefordensis (strain DSM 17166 / LMG 22922 / DPN7) TaxID=1247726 RepID=W0PCY3_ADVMD|nr:5-deoxy-glucuronate isomerase [Advenella mimigardefordensis]AHG64616.1 putative 5-deoxy-glucuronate isomerase [Advenella mimigardefordensis DPN7]
MSLKVKATANTLVADVPKGAGGLNYVGFQAYRFDEQKTMEFHSEANELCLVILSGKASLQITGPNGTYHWDDLGDRTSVFEDKSPYAAYIAPYSDVKVIAQKGCELGVAIGPGNNGQYQSRLIRPESMKRSSRGQASNTRYVCDILPETEPAHSLLVVEVITPSGNSSSYPPHKHDRDAIPQESALEETYYHRLNPPQGFAFQRVYTDNRDIDEAICVENHDVVKVPKGYHPVVVPHGYTSYYLNVMAGPKRVWHFYNDPEHEWMLKG